MVVVLAILLIATGCSFSVYPIKMGATRIDQAIGWDGLMKVETFDNQVWRFTSISKTVTGEFYGYNKDNYIKVFGCFRIKYG